MINANTKSSTRFQSAQDDHRTLPLNPLKGVSKMQDGRFP